MKRTTISTMALTLLTAIVCHSVYAQQGGTTTVAVKQRCATDSDCRAVNLFCSRPVCVGAQITKGEGVEISEKAGYCELAPAEPPRPLAAACKGQWVCSEQHDRWEVEGADADKDGHDSLACGGDDCDDNDANRAPTNQEICDEHGVDEDCRVTTFGHKDSDGDGAIDAMCRNYHD